MRILRLSKSVLLALLIGLLVLAFGCAEDTKINKEDLSFGDDAKDEDGDDGSADSKGGEDAKDKPAVINIVEEYAEYRTVKPKGLSLVEDFQGDWQSIWTHSSDSKYNGEFEVGTGANPEIPGDRGLIIPMKAKHYGISTLIPGLTDLTEDDFVVQYEVRMDEGMTCGGAYLKLLTTDFTEPKEFDNEARYSVMFGPDKCGSTDKVHFIFQSKNPKTGKYTEHHLKSPPSIPSMSDKASHLFTLIVRKNKTFELLVDNEVKKSGKLSEDFEPSVQPAEEIDDPNDTKPEDWVDTKKIPDPDAKKPEDWDEDALMEIPDPDAKKPEKWDEEMPKEIPDPKAKKPEEWDDEEDGEWKPKMIPNPECTDGCGPWTRPMKKNPAYKGKWSPPLIDNPEYKGEWKPRKIPNPEYYKVKEPSLLGIAGLGIEIWTMDQGVVFDNIVVGTDVEAAKKYALSTWKVKSDSTSAKKKAEAEKAKEEADAGKSKIQKYLDIADDALDKINDYLEPVERKIFELGGGPIISFLEDKGIAKPMVVVIAIPLLITLLFLAALTRGKRPAAVRDAAAEAKKTDKRTKDDKPPTGKDEKSVEEKILKTADKAEGATTGGPRKRKTAQAD